MIGNLIKVGDVFKLNCGISVTVTKYNGTKEVTVEDELGNFRITTGAQLRAGCVSWARFGIPDRIKLTKYLVGDVFQTDHYGKIEIIESLESRQRVVRFIDSGYVCTASTTLISGGTLTDKSIPKFSKCVEMFPVGSVWSSVKYGEFEVISSYQFSKLWVRWKNTGHEQRVYKHSEIKSGKLRDTTLISDIKNKLQYDKSMYYVYTASYGGEIMYVGKGFGVRYQHINSGKSSSYFINEYYFSGKTLDVAIYKDGLTNDEALLLEDSLIKELQPKFNIIGNTNFGYWASIETNYKNKKYPNENLILEND